MSGEVISRLARYFAEPPSRAGILARAALGRPAPGDAELARELRAKLAAELRRDGSLGGAALPTIWRVISTTHRPTSGSGRIESRR